MRRVYDELLLYRTVLDGTFARLWMYLVVEVHFLGNAMDSFCSCFCILYTARDDFAFVFISAVLDLHRSSFLLFCKRKTTSLLFLFCTSFSEAWQPIAYFEF
jgi:hypothetical protein